MAKIVQLGFQQSRANWEENPVIRGVRERLAKDAHKRVRIYYGEQVYKRAILSVNNKNQSYVNR